MKRVIFVLLIILLSITWASTLLYGKIPSRERLALERLFDKTGGDNWQIKQPWKVGHPKGFRDPGTECTWEGIICDNQESTVLGIKLNDKNLSGEIPADLVSLQNLETLVLSNNQLTKVDENVGKLTNLTTLNLSNNELKGKIPQWIENLTNLEVLNLSNNRFTGGIPFWIGNLKNLEILLLDGNNLEGPIPKELANLSKLTVLRVGHNKLTGEIPAALIKLTGLVDNKSNFKWNGLYTNDRRLRDFLRKKQDGRDWESTQTIAPGGITASSLSKDSIRIRWKPIAYTADSGAYKIFYSTAKGGLYKDGPIIDDKAKKSAVVQNLTPSTRYYFKIQTWTNENSNNRYNKVVSEYSEVVSATTRGITISGSVTTSKGEGVPGVQIKALKKESGEVTDSDETDSKGNYHLAVTPGWSGTVTPSKKGYEFLLPEQKYFGLWDDLPNQNYSAISTTVIAGRVTDSKGKGAPDVEIMASNKEGRTITNAEGQYILGVRYGWSGIIIPVKGGYDFSPPSRHFFNVNTKTLGQNYTAKVNTIISGKVTNLKGRGLPGVILTFSGQEGTGISATTDSEGYYSTTVPYQWTGTATPSKAGYTFTPSQRQYLNVFSTQAGENYKALK